MKKGRLFACLLISLPVCLAGPACRTTAASRPEGNVHYVGSSTVALFLRGAEEVYGAIDFELDTEPESEGGEQAIIGDLADLAGTAREPGPGVAEAGVLATLIGRDAIAVIVNARNPVTDLTLEELRRIFTGEVASWSELGGPDLPVRAFVVGAESATRQVFGDAILDGAGFEGCEEVRPDTAIVDAVSGEPGAIGQISFSFLGNAGGVRPLAIEGERPEVTNFDYPVSRPLYLLRRAGNPVVEAFVEWAQSLEGQRVVMERFVGARVLGSVRVEEAPLVTGTLVVRTQTRAVYDGGIYYYPHRGYEILDRHGNLLRRVPNRRGLNDEDPMRVDLPPGTYLIRAETDRAERPEFFVTVEADRIVELDVEGLLRAQR